MLVLILAGQRVLTYLHSFLILVGYFSLLFGCEDSGSFFNGGI